MLWFQPKIWNNIPRPICFACIWNIARPKSPAVQLTNQKSILSHCQALPRAISDRTHIGTLSWSFVISFFPSQPCAELLKTGECKEVQIFDRRGRMWEGQATLRYWTPPWPPGPRQFAETSKKCSNLTISHQLPPISSPISRPTRQFSHALTSY